MKRARKRPSQLVTQRTESEEPPYISPFDVLSPSGGKIVINPLSPDGIQFAASRKMPSTPSPKVNYTVDNLKEINSHCRCAATLTIPHMLSHFQSTTKNMLTILKMNNVMKNR
jgi:hypothetical protein